MYSSQDVIKSSMLLPLFKTVYKTHFWDYHQLFIIFSLISSMILNLFFFNGDFNF